MHPTISLSNVNTIDADEKKPSLHVPHTRHFKPLIMLKKDVHAALKHRKGHNATLIH